MKQLQIFLMAVLMMTLVLTSCGKDDDGAIGVDAGSGTVTATVDGKSWKSKSGADGAVLGSSQGTNIIQAYNEDGSYIGLTIFGNLTAGTTINTTAGEFQAQYKPDFNATQAYQAVGGIGSGSVTITKATNDKVEGTFQFTGSSFDTGGNELMLSVTNGNFSINR